MKQKNMCKGELTEKEIYKAVVSIVSNKSPGNNGLTKKFYYTFGTKLKIFLWALRESKGKKSKCFTRTTNN